MVEKRHAEIAGAGIAGLTLAAALGQRGWSVRVHERADDLRELGVGTTLWGNGLEALDAIGALDEALAGATAIHSIEVHDESDRVIRSLEMQPTNRSSYVVLRTSLHRALHKAALAAGVEIVTASNVVGATPDGALLRDDGQRFAGDLAVGADGYRSRVRDSLDLTIEAGHVTDAFIGRVAVPGRVHRSIGTIREHWSGTRCCGILTCGALDYLFLSPPEHCPVNLGEVAEATLDRRTWVEAFPVLDTHLPQTVGEVLWGRYSIATCHAWSRGKTAVLGDAAHAMPSTLAQGAGCSMANALALAVLLERHDVEPALALWEKAQRETTELTQRWSVLYLTLLKRWPDGLMRQRADMVRDAFSHPGVAQHFSTAARQRVLPTAAARGDHLQSA